MHLEEIEYIFFGKVVLDQIKKKGMHYLTRFSNIDDLIYCLMMQYLKD